MKRRFLITFALVLLAFSNVAAQEPPETISGGVLNARATSLPKPVYPPAAEPLGTCGPVYISVLVDKTGRVVSARAVGLGHPLLRQAALEAARQATFEPFVLSGRTVRVSGVIVYKFTCAPREQAAEELAETAEREASKAKKLADLAEARAVEEEIIREYSGGSVRLLGGGVINDRALSLPDPEYPQVARTNGVGGPVRVIVVVDEGGNVIKAQAVSGDQMLRPAAENAARAARFQPTKLNGEPVRISGSLVYVFRPGTVAKASASRNELVKLGAVFSFFAEVLKRDEDLGSVIDDYAAKFPQFKEEFEPLRTLTGDSAPAERKETIDKAFDRVRGRLGSAERWRFDIGNRLGRLMLLFKNTEVKSIDESVLRAELLKIRDLLFSAPDDFPANIFDDFKTLAGFAAEQNLNDPRQKEKIFMAVSDLINSISAEDVN